MVFSLPSSFVKNSSPISEEVVFYFVKNSLLFYDDVLATKEHIYSSGITPSPRYHLGTSENCSYWVCSVSTDIEKDQHFISKGVRGVFQTLPAPLNCIVGYAAHINHWNQSTQHCGYCGTQHENHQTEVAKWCSKCNISHYPRIAPATITAIIKDDSLLLALNSRNINKKMYSLIAGFVEPGETLEQCVQRETEEEVGISVTNIRYFTSAPWPFPNSLMVAFIADYSSGELTPDNEEIVEAQWYRADSLPLTPPNFTVAGKLISWFRKSYS